jgi:hypothetical protein
MKGWKEGKGIRTIMVVDRKKKQSLKRIKIHCLICIRAHTRVARVGMASLNAHELDVKKFKRDVICNLM